MKVEAQGRGECWLVTSCMLADYPLVRIRQEIVDKFGESWQDMFRSPHRKTHTVDRQKMASFVVRRLGIPTMLSLNWAYGWTIRRGPAPTLRVPGGRGAMLLVKVIATSAKLRLIAHVVAFEDGKVYDPNGAMVHDGDNFAWTYRGWRLERTIQVRRPGYQP